MPRDDDAKREIRALVDQALDNATVAEELNRRGRTDARGDPYTARCIQEFRSNWNWPSCTQLHRAGLREQGYVSEHELASTMGIHSCTVRQRAHRKQGIEARRFKVGRRTFTMYKELSSGTAENCDPGLACPRDPGLSPQQNEKDAS